MSRPVAVADKIAAIIMARSRAGRGHRLLLVRRLISGPSRTLLHSHHAPAPGDHDAVGRSLGADA